MAKTPQRPADRSEAIALAIDSLNRSRVELELRLGRMLAGDPDARKVRATRDKVIAAIAELEKLRSRSRRPPGVSTIDLQTGRETRFRPYRRKG